MKTKINFKATFKFLTKSTERVVGLLFFIAICSYMTIRGDSDAPIEQLAGYYLGTSFEVYPELMSQLKSDDGLTPIKSEVNKDSHHFTVKSDERKPMIQIWAGGKNHLINTIKLTFKFSSERICDTAYASYEAKLDDQYNTLAPGFLSRYSNDKQRLDIDSDCDETGHYFTILTYDNYLSQIALNYKNGFDTLEIDSVLNERRYGSDFIPLTIPEPVLPEIPTASVEEISQILKEKEVAVDKVVVAQVSE